MNIKTRLESVDALRGLMMILMALDHVRDYLGNVTFDYATNELKTNGFLFFTRWITNLCAPTFVFLVGTSMYLALKAGKTKKELSLFLLTRGIWLIVTDFFILHVAWTFTFDFSLIEFDVLTVTGAGMILLSGLLFAPKALIFALCAIILLGQTLWVGQEAARIGIGQFSWLYSPQMFLIDVFQKKIAIYPWYVLIPWVIIPGLGYLFGPIFDFSAAKRSRLLIQTGSACLIAFIIIRAVNGYGDPNPWIYSSNPTVTTFSFLNITKYPPSLLYFLITLGLSSFILCFLDKRPRPITSILAVYGKTPFAFYVLHIFVIHAIALLLAYMRFGHEAIHTFMNIKFISFDPNDLNLSKYGYSLSINYVIWIGVVILFYPFCKWYGNIKRKYKSITLLSYL